MDIITHGLFAYTLCKLFRVQTKSTIIITSLGSLIPDIGELPIQRELAIKYGEVLAVYDSRTSDVNISQMKSVTLLYDLLHSFVLPTVLLIASILFRNSKVKKVIIALCTGLYLHILLDSFTHGKVWALKLFFPISNNRILILSDAVGNWWEWKPSIDLHVFQLPIICVFIWATLITIIFIKNLFFKHIN